VAGRLPQSCARDPIAGSLKNWMSPALFVDLGRDRLDPRVFENADAVFHTAAAVSDWAPWSYYVANTIRPTEVVCDAMVAAGCRRLVHFSSVGVYGCPPHDMVVSEDFARPHRTAETSIDGRKSNPKKSSGSARA